jgi:DNA (cytosine-5)-methyltransferase 1
MSKNRLKFLDLFSGCGGFSTGMEMAGHHCLLGIDFDKEAVKSFARNHPKAHALHMDIHQLTKKKLESLIDINAVDMVIGGPPCQGFSTVGKGNANDERNSLFQQFVRIVKITNPKIVVFENVTGILAKKNQKILHQIFQSFENMGYHMDAKVLSSDEFGVPSRRRRTIIMGVKNGLPLFPEVTHGPQASRPYVTVKDAFKTHKKQMSNHDITQAQLTNQLDVKRLEHLPPGQGIRYEKDEKKYLPLKLRYGVNWSEISEKRFRQTRLQRLDWNTPAPTILTSRTMYYHPVEPRYLTPREAATCQSFPLDFVFEGGQTAQFRQIGNAVPPLMAMALGEVIKKIKFNLHKIEKPSLLKRKDYLEKAFTYREKNYA